MRFTKNSAFVLALLFIVVAAEYYYMRYYSDGANKENSHSSSQAQESPSSEANRKLSNEDKQILSTVDDYQAGYKKGCQEVSKGTRETTQDHNDKNRPFVLGAQRGKEECSAKATQKEDEYDMGYKDGCSSVVKEPIKNENLYSSSLEYRKGWDRGSDICGDRGDPQAD